MTLLLLLVISGSIPELSSKEGDLFTGQISIIKIFIGYESMFGGISKHTKSYF